MANAIIQLKDVFKAYERVGAVRGVTFSAQPGEIVVLLGSSGCGKTTTLRLVAGLEKPDSGEILLNGEVVAGRRAWVPPEERRVGMVFQDYALFPHLTVAENVTFALKGWPAKQRKDRVSAMLELAGLPTLGGRYPHQLSGGQQQRVALARALAADPAVVLLDEPFSNLDAALRTEMREEVRRILKETGATAIFVTHDQEEALSLADSVVVMREGKILQIGTPQEVYLQPANHEVARFMGDANIMRGEADGDAVEFPLGRVPLMTSMHGPVDVMLRPEALAVVPDATSATCVNRVRFYGHDQLVEVKLENGLIVQARTWADLNLVPGLPVRVDLRGAVHAFPVEPVGSIA